MTCKAKSKSSATPITSFSKSKDVSLPQLSTVNPATLSVLYLHCKLLFSVCQSIWTHLEGKSSPFTDVSALVNFTFLAMETLLVLLDEYCGKFWFPQLFISDEDGSGDKDVVEVKSSKCPAHTIKPPARATPIVKVPVHSSKTKQKSRPVASLSTQVTIKTEPSSLKRKACDTSPPQPPAGKRAHTVTKATDKSADPKGKKRAIDPPPDEGEKDGAEDMDIDELDPSQPSATKSI
ncbi:hypothetical protein Moror_11263 [Moniliophthora roreri MCA 2997]|uniref:Uncharacterized protein n=1 Tax=Moniliophthora roreri (strain MCA 2997) TaxID=1381753 RepID=V2WL47_MONRO|nr:hypothetical protein Moror_11263 [Moniliophthora roreri MCA 2997]